MRSIKYLALSVTVMCLASTARSQNTISLEEAIRISGDYSGTIKAARSDSLSGIYDLGAARALRYPTASLGATSFYISSLQSVSLPFTSLTVGTHNNYQADFRLSLPLWTGGRISNQINIQSAISDAKTAALESARLANVYNTRKAYLAVLLAGAMLNAAHASTDRVRMILKDTQDRFHAGTADSVDILGAQFDLLRTAQLETDRISALQNARELLGRFLGMDIRAGTKFDSIPDPNSGPMHPLGQEPPTREELNRPELTVFKSRARAADFSVNLSRSGYFPGITGFGGYSLGKPNRDLFGNKWNDYWSAGLNLNWDFNLGNRVVKLISSARAAAGSAKSQQDDMEESLLLQAKIAWNDLVPALQDIDYSRSQYRIAQRQFELGEEAYRSGSLSQNRLRELWADLESAEQLFRASAINYFVVETEYLYAIGSPRIYGGLSR